MIINDVKNYTGGTASSFTGREYLAPGGSDTLVIALHPEELKGSADGSQLNVLESIDWWPKFARNQNYPFNIFALQTNTTTLHGILNTIIPAMRKRYNPKNIVLVGLGRGAVDMYNILSENKDADDIKLVIAVSGYSERTGSIPSKWTSVKGLAFHGVNDTRYPISLHQDTVNKYNNSFPGSMALVSFANTGYEAWTKAFNANTSNDQALQFVINELSLAQPTPAPPATNCDEIQQQLTAAQAQITSLQAQISTLTSQRNAAQAEVTRLKTGIQASLNQMPS